MNTPTREACAYAPFYCEENVWHLAQRPEFAASERVVVFVTNPYRRCALFHQRAANEPAAAVVWDYHVVLLARRAAWEVFDLDTTLAFPCPVGVYLDATFASRTLRPALLAPRFRVVEAEVFVRTLASDRSHMRNAKGEWNAPPPPWRLILPRGAPTNLGRFVDVDDAFVGEVVDMSVLRRRFG